MGEDIRIIGITDPEFPPLLKQINDPPQQLYVRGDVELLSHEPMLAVVGSRKANAYGKLCIEKLLPPVIRAGVPIVSGMAFGIDSLSHQACVAEKRPTIAVLGTGIDDKSIYPRAHKKLADEILAHDGTLVSEYPPGTVAYKGNFPMRNRIIAGLTKATLIVQAAVKSGSLITARLATEYNRDVGVVPGPITDIVSQGTNSLLQNGAAAILSAEDLLALLDITPKKAKNKTLALLTKEQQQLVAHLSANPRHVDEISGLVQLPTQQILPLLLELELLDQIQNVGGMKYVRK